MKVLTDKYQTMKVQIKKLDKEFHDDVVHDYDDDFLDDLLKYEGKISKIEIKDVKNGYSFHLISDENIIWNEKRSENKWTCSFIEKERFNVFFVLISDEFFGEELFEL